MWWINKNGVVEGPLSVEQLQKRIKLNMLRSLDRVSEDKVTWVYVKDTTFWNPTKTLVRRSQPSAPLLPPPPSRQQSTQRGANIDNMRGVDFVDITAPVAGKPIVERTRHNTPVRSSAKSHFSKGILIAAISSVTILLGIGVLCYAITMNSAPKPAETPPPVAAQVDFNSVKDKLAIIEYNDGSGSGFLLAMYGKTYLMSNEHVLRSSSSPRVRLLDGQKLHLGEFSVATDRDLARYEVIGCSITPFQINEDMPNVGDAVAVYGNSLGGGVATELKGYIQGVGPDRIEAGVQIVPGNSGSPLVSANGKVIGVASFLRLSRDGKTDWTVKDTSYDGKIRRFAVRFTNVGWKTIDRKLYEEQTARLEEFETYWKLLVPYLVYEDTKVEPGSLVFNDLTSKAFKSREFGFEEILRTLSKTYQRLRNVALELDKQNKGRDVFMRRLIDMRVTREVFTQAVANYDNETAELEKKFGKTYRKMNFKRKEALTIAQSFLTETKWASPNMLNGYSRDDPTGSVKDYRERIKKLMDFVNQKLKDFNGTGEDDEDDE